MSRRRDSSSRMAVSAAVAASVCALAFATMVYWTTSHAATSQSQTFTGVLRINGQPGKAGLPADIAGGGDTWVNADNAACGGGPINADGSFTIVVAGAAAQPGCYQPGGTIRFHMGHGLDVASATTATFTPGATTTQDVEVPRFWAHIDATLTLDGHAVPDGYHLRIFRVGGIVGCSFGGPTTSASKVSFSNPDLVNGNGGCAVEGAEIGFQLLDANKNLVASTPTTFIHHAGANLTLSLAFGSSIATATPTVSPSPTPSTSPTATTATPTPTTTAATTTSTATPSPTPTTTTAPSSTPSPGPSAPPLFALTTPPQAMPANDFLAAQGECAFAVYGFDQSGWLRYLKGLPSWLVTLKTVVPSHSYWVLRSC